MSKWIVSVDLGQTIDPTAIAVLEMTTRREVVDRYYSYSDETRPPDVPEPLSSWYSPSRDGKRLSGGNLPAFIDVRHLERMPLRTSYVDVVNHIGRLLSRAPLASPKADLVVDQTGVGRPVVDMFRRAFMRPIAVTITAGDQETRAGGNDWRVAKLLLVSRLQALLHTGELRISKNLKEAQNLAMELQDFRASITETGYARFGAREGAHDDLVLAVAIGAWWASREMFAQIGHVLMQGHNMKVTF